jgi:hypothetical protein
MCSCHIDPHEWTGERDCSACHNASSFLDAQFDHVDAVDCQRCHLKDSSIPHYPAQCSTCHTGTATWAAAAFNYVALTDCQSCHATWAPVNQYLGQCSTCHSTTTWAGARFNHTFQLNHEGANSDCVTCHPGNSYPSYTCFGCHDEGRVNREHREEGITDLSHCIRCHPTGKEPDDD